MSLQSIQKKLLVLLALSLFVLSPLAAGNKTVSLGSSDPADGSTEVAVDAELVMTFTSNVINMKVSENNMTCFSLVDDKGEAVEMEVLMADDQIEPELKRIIKLKTFEDLDKNSSYSIVVSGDLKAKNGSALGEDITISFTTAP